MNSYHSICKCSLCGCIHYNTISFKNGYVCEQCLEFIRFDFPGGDSTLG